MIFGKYNVPVIGGIPILICPFLRFSISNNSLDILSKDNNI